MKGEIRTNKNAIIVVVDLKDIVNKSFAIS